MSPSPRRANLPEFLALERLVGDEFRAAGVATKYRRQELYGGQSMAQALLAAGATIAADRAPHSIHAYFLRAGDSASDFTLSVTRDRDGSRFSHRRVEAQQDGTDFFTASMSFEVPSLGVERQLNQPPAVDPPESLPADLAAPLLYGIDYRVPSQNAAPDFPDYADLARVLPTTFWARSAQPLPADPLLHAALLLYLSDWSHGMAEGHSGQWTMSASLDHSMWFHRPHRVDEWSLFHLAPQRAAGGRGWYSGHVYDRAGVHVASFVQESVYGRIAAGDSAASEPSTATPSHSTTSTAR
jgi:acyl-CoA thioesterase-2